MHTIYSFFGENRNFSLDPVAFQIGDIPIYWYGLIIATGFMIALIYGFRRSADYKINNDAMIDVILVGTLGAVVCARAYYVLTSLDKYETFMEMLDIRQGGLAIYGGIIGALVFGGLACVWRKVNVLDMFDLAAPAFLIGQAVGRWGNFINQEAFGTNTTAPWGMLSDKTIEYLSNQQQTLADQGVYVFPHEAVHPCFLYESLWCIIGFVLIHFLSKHRHFKGEGILQYIVWYGLGRFFIEQVRTDSLMIGSFKISQLVAAACVVLGLTALIVINIKQKKNKQQFLVA